MLEVERGTFTPFVLSKGGGMARERIVFYKPWGQLLATKKEKNYKVVLGWLDALHLPVSFNPLLCVYAV